MAIIDPNTPELLNHAENRYTLAVEASKRARELVDGAQPLFDGTENMKPLKVAVEEIDRGLLTYESPAPEERRDAE